MSRIQVGKLIENFLNKEYQEPKYAETVETAKENENALDLLDKAYKENK